MSETGGETPQPKEDIIATNEHLSVLEHKLLGSGIESKSTGEAIDVDAQLEALLAGDVDAKKTLLTPVHILENNTDLKSIEELRKGKQVNILGGIFDSTSYQELWYDDKQISFDLNELDEETKMIKPQWTMRVKGSTNEAGDLDSLKLDEKYEKFFDFSPVATNIVDGKAIVTRQLLLKMPPEHI